MSPIEPPIATLCTTRFDRVSTTNKGATACGGQRHEQAGTVRAETDSVRGRPGRAGDSQVFPLSTSMTATSAYPSPHRAT